MDAERGKLDPEAQVDEKVEIAIENSIPAEKEMQQLITFLQKETLNARRFKN